MLRSFLSLSWKDVCRLWPAWLCGLAYKLFEHRILGWFNDFIDQHTGWLIDVLKSCGGLLNSMPMDITTTVMILFLLGIAVHAAIAPERNYDVVKDFSISMNPNGQWSYGYSSSGEAVDFIACTSMKAEEKVATWRGNKNSDDGSPSIAHNKDNQPFHFRSMTFPPDCLNLHPGPKGHRAIVRFTVPRRGKYTVQGAFKALDRTTTDPHVLVNGAETVTIKPINNGNPREDFSFTQRFKNGDTIDFAVGDGGNGNECDSTGLTLTVTPVGAIITPSPGR